MPQLIPQLHGIRQICVLVVDPTIQRAIMTNLSQCTIFEICRTRLYDESAQVQACTHRVELSAQTIICGCILKLPLISTTFLAKLNNFCKNKYSASVTFQCLPLLNYFQSVKKKKTIVFEERKYHSIVCRPVIMSVGLRTQLHKTINIVQIKQVFARITSTLHTKIHKI